MNYEQKYKEALERAKRLHSEPTGGTERIVCEQIFPELKESEDEGIRKGLIKAFGTIGKKDWGGLIVMDILAWLEKQGKHADFISKIQVGDEVTRNEDGELVNLSQLDRVAKPADKVEPKFKVGDWCIDNEDDTIFQIVKVLDNTYTYRTNEGKEYSCTHYSLENDSRLWTIQDAKDGDVLYSLDSKQPFIFKHRKPNEQAEVYCGINIYSKFFVGNTKDCIITTDKYIPATKEQHDILFQTMKEAGYEWYAEKKELKKIENEIEISFGAKDSELQEATYYIPKGFHAEIDDDKVVIKKDEESTARR